MSAILSADDLNDFISPGVACIKPVETLPLQKPSENEYEVTTEDKVAAQAPPAQISLTDCLACSGCVTSAEAVLVSLQSHSEVLSALDSAPMLSLEHLRTQSHPSVANGVGGAQQEHGKVFVASVCPQVRASLAATYGATEKETGYMIEQLFSGTQGLGVGGKYGNRFTWVVDTNAMRDACLVMEAEDLMSSTQDDSKVKRPMLTSACPGWVCYAEKTHPHVIPHMSKVKSPQALTGTLIKSLLSKKLGIPPSQVFHLAVMPCFDKKLEASRAELTDTYWATHDENAKLMPDSTRDVDCVITAREILMLAESRGISFPNLPREPLEEYLQTPFPDDRIGGQVFRRRNNGKDKDDFTVRGTSGGFLYHILCTQQALYPGSTIVAERGRNADVVDYKVMRDGNVLFKAARFYGFRNIQNLVRKLKPARASRMPGGKMVGARKPGAAKATSPDNAYVEVMACPGGCTNGGGQIKVDDLGELQAVERGFANQKEWHGAIDEAYFSMDDEEDVDMAGATDRSEGAIVNGIDTAAVKDLLQHWSSLVEIDIHPLTHTTFRAVESDVGKTKVGDTDHVVEIASKIGGGW
jgi:iron only hydrogenase large subunit-like protein